MNKRALLHVSDTTNIVDFAGFLMAKGYELIGAGHTYKLLIENKIPTLNVYELTGHKQILDGKINTIHPNIYGGLLANRESSSDIREILEHNIGLIDLLVCNMYSVKDEILKDSPHEEIVEAISVERGSLIRAAAKNYMYTTVIVDCTDYYNLLSEIEREGSITLETRKKFAAKAFRYTAFYDSVVASYLTDEEYPEKLTLSYEKVRETIYGENPHQTGALYKEVIPTRFIDNAERLSGPNPSFNNINDADLSLALVSEFLGPTAVFVKHLNPIAVFSNEDLSKAINHFKKEEVYGGVFAFNREVSLSCAKKIKESTVDLVLAPSFEEGALEILKENEELVVILIETSYKIRSKKIFGIEGGILIEESDIDHNLDLHVVTKKEPTKEEMDACLFAEIIAKYAKSNSVILTDGTKTLGIGTGQANLVRAAKITLDEAKGNESDIVMAVDSYFSSLEIIKEAAKLGVKCIIQPGSVVRNEEVIEVCDLHNISMIFSGVRHFRH